jgi:hypothetical protein
VVEVEVVAGVQTGQAPVASGDRQTWLCVVVCKRKEDQVLADRRNPGSLRALAETRVQTLRSGRIDMAEANRVLRRVSSNGLDRRVA